MNMLLFNMLLRLLLWPQLMSPHTSRDSTAAITGWQLQLPGHHSRP